MSLIYVWHCPRDSCDAQGQTNVKPLNNRQLCMKCMASFVVIETMIPLYLFD